MGEKLSLRESKFVGSLLTGASKAEAARAAGYQGTACQRMASRLLAREAVQAALQEAVDEEQAMVKVERDVLRRRLFDMANCDLTQAFDGEWNLRPSEDIPEAVRRMVLSCRTWDGPQGSGSCARFASPLDAARAYLKTFVPSTVHVELDLQMAAQEVLSDMDALMERLGDCADVELEDED